MGASGDQPAPGDPPAATPCRRRQGGRQVHLCPLAGQQAALRLQEHFPRGVPGPRPRAEGGRPPWLHQFHHPQLSPLRYLPSSTFVQ